MNKFFAILAVGLGCAALYAAETVQLEDRFDNLENFKKNWDFRNPTAPADGVLLVERNHFSPMLKTALDADAAGSRVEVEVAPQSNAGFAGVKIDGLLFFLRNGQAVVVFRPTGKTQDDSRARKLDDYKEGDFGKIAVTRTKVGDDYNYLYQVNGQTVTELKGLKFPVTHQVGLLKSQTDAKFKNFKVTRITQ